MRHPKTHDGTTSGRINTKRFTQRERDDDEGVPATEGTSDATAADEATDEAVGD